MLESNEHYEISKLDDTTWLVYDLTKSIPTPHYYRTFSGASAKCRSIMDNSMTSVLSA